MTVRIGADDLDQLQMPQPLLLRDVAGILPESDELHVRLDRHGFRSTQRLALAEWGGMIVVAFWPAELKDQALYLYSGRRAGALIAEARTRCWEVLPALQLAYHTSPPSRRLYMLPEIDALEYAQRWAGTDGELIGAHDRDVVRTELWPRLKTSGYAADEHDLLLERFLSYVGRRDVHLRPGLRVRRQFDPNTSAGEIRGDVEAILTAADEPPLPR